MAADPNCIFCKIAAGDIPSTTVLDSPLAIAFLDVGPLADGHVLLIPRDHYERLDQMPADVFGQVAALLPKLGSALQRVAGVDAYNVLQNNGAAAGQEVGHVHFHLIPRCPGDGLGYRWNAKSYAAGRADELAARFSELLD